MMSRPTREIEYATAVDVIVRIREEGEPFDPQPFGVLCALAEELGFDPDSVTVDAMRAAVAAHDLGAMRTHFPMSRPWIAIAYEVAAAYARRKLADV